MGKRVTPMFKSLGLLITRVIFGSYLAVHGAQKLFGSFGGHGLDATGAGFESMGMKPGKVMAAIAGASELGGGVLTAAGIADPLGPLAIAGTMVVASAVHRKQGPLSTNGGFELPLTNFAVATALLASGPGHLRLGPHLSKSLTRLSVLGGAALAGYSLNQLLRAQPAPAAEEAEDEEIVEPS
jgi:putative oxidoreductase